MSYKYYRTANNIFRISRADLGYRIEYLYTYAKSEHAPTPTTWLKAYNGIQYIPELITKGGKNKSDRYRQVINDARANEMRYRYLKLTYDHTKLPIDWETTSDVDAFLGVNIYTGEVEVYSSDNEWESERPDIDYIIDKDRRFLKDFRWITETELNKHLAMRELIK